jgi:hypothetical protein
VSSPVGLLPVAAQPLPPLLPASAGAVMPTTPPVVTLDGSPQALAALAALANAASFAGTIAAGESAGSLLLVTSFGTFALDSATPFPIGAQLTLQTVAGTPGGVAILTVDDTPTVASAPIQSATNQPVSDGPEEAPPSIVDLGTVVTATVIAAVATAAANEVSTSQTVSFGPASPSAPARDSTGTAEQIATISAGSPSGWARDAATASNPDARLIAEIAESDGASNINRSGNSDIARTAAGPVFEELFSTGRPDAKESLPSDPGIAARSDIATGGQRDRGTIPQALLSDVATTVPTASSSPSFRALPVGASLVLRILAFQIVTTPGSTDDGATPALAGPEISGPALSGIVRTADPAGAIVDTAIGALRLTPAPPLPAGAQIALRLLPGEPATATLTIVAPPSVDTAAGDLPANAATTTASSEEPNQTGASERPAATLQPRGLQQPAPTAPASVAALPSGGISSRQTTEIPPGTAFITRIFLAPTATAAGAAPQAVVGTVLDDPAATPPAATLVETPLGVLAVAPRLALPAGTLLLLAAQDTPLIPDTLLTGRPTGFERGWPALQAAVGAISQTGPSLATHLLADLSVHGGETLAATLLFLVATLRGGGPSTWPGQAIERALALAGRDDLKQRLGEDVGALRRIAADPATGRWQVFLLPVHDGTAFRPVRLYLARRDKGGTKGSRDEDNSRFVLEFELSRIGALQLDGFIRRHRFDLALRSHIPLAPGLRADITRIFHARIAAAGLAGEIDFATVAHFDVAPLDALQAHVGLAV